LEVIFVENGKYDYGYEVNKKKIYRRQFGASTMIGGFQVHFEERHQFNIRASTEVTGYAIVKKNWINIMKEFPLFASEIQNKLINFYLRQILRPLTYHKNKDI
jgi:hypothetical protein